MIAAVICRETGWTFEEYLNTDAAFIDVLLAMLRAEAKAQKKKQ